MSQTYQICEVMVTLPSLGTITTDGPGNQIKNGDKCCVHLYAVKPDWRSGGIFEGFIVGWFTFYGYSEEPHKHSQKIMMPDGFKLIALSVDEYGIPTSWDSLPVHFAGGFIGNPQDALDGIADLPRYKISSDYAIQRKIAGALDTELVRLYEQFGNAEPGKTAVVFLADRWVAIEGRYTPDEMRDAVEYIKRKRKEKADAKAMAESSPFVMNDGQVLIKDAVIQKVQLSRTETDPRKGYAINVGIGPQIKTNVKLSPEMEKAISEVVSAELKKNLQPGGTIWTSLKNGV